VSADPPAGPLRFGVFEVEAAGGELRRQGVRVRIHDQPFRVLLALLERPGEIVTRQELRERLWAEDTFVEFDNGLNNAIKRLRDALGDAAEHPQFVETVPRRGYRFIAPVTHVDLATAPPLPTAVPPPAASARLRRPERVLVGVAIVVIALALATGAYWTIGKGPPALGPISSVAVMPFQELSVHDGRDYFADGMTEAVILELSRIRPLRVTSRTSAMVYKKTTKGSPQIAKELGVDALVEGSVQREGSRVRVTVQLIRAADDAHVWSNAYEREISSILALHSDVAQAIAGEIESTVLASSSATVVTRRIDPDVYQLYLQGRQLLNRGTEPELRQALATFEQVVARDPGYAPGHAAIASVWDVLAGAGSYASPREAFPKMKAAASRALEIDPSLTEALVRMAAVAELNEWRLEAAEEAYKRIIAQDPNSVETFTNYSLHLARRLRRAEALDMAQRAYALDPRSPDVGIVLAARLSEVGRRDEALRQMEHSRDLDPAYYEGWVHLSHIYEAVKRPVEQVAAARKGVELSGASPHAVHALARAYATTGNRRDAELLVDELDRRPIQRNPFELARLHLLLNRADRALFWLERACEERAPSMAFLRYIYSAAGFNSVRQDPRFDAVLRCAGVPAHPPSQ
jgi:TolB-like protein/DNA-binding winged helix-turn-helix (wHTH) protein/Flp pilus assembly protein TadD